MKTRLPAAIALIGMLVVSCGAEKRTPEPRENELVILNNNFGEEVFISNDPASWVDKNLVARVKNGTKATIQEVYKAEITPDYTLTRLKVNTNNPTYTGWVHSFDAGYSTEKENEK
jgi:hypothetical protein